MISLWVDHLNLNITNLNFLKHWSWTCKYMQVIDFYLMWTINQNISDKVPAIFKCVMFLSITAKDINI